MHWIWWYLVLIEFLMYFFQFWLTLVLHLVICAYFNFFWISDFAKIVRNAYTHKCMHDIDSRWNELKKISWFLGFFFFLFSYFPYDDGVRKATYSDFFPYLFLLWCVFMFGVDLGADSYQTFSSGRSGGEGHNFSNEYSFLSFDHLFNHFCRCYHVTFECGPNCLFPKKALKKISSRWFQFQWSPLNQLHNQS